MLQPISYSLIFNILVIAVMGALCWVNKDPALFLATIMALPHITQRFDTGRDPYDDDGDDDDGPSKMGFLSDPRR